MSAVSDAEFDRKLDALSEEDDRYSREAYTFVADAVSYTVGKLKHHRHVSALELLKGTRDFARENYDFLAGELLKKWGIHSASDVGNVVYLLIGVGILTASREDDPDDFKIDFDLFPVQNAASGKRFRLPKIDL